MRRKSLPELRRQGYIGGGDMEWHGLVPHKPDWSDTSRFLAFTLRTEEGGGLYVAFNTSHLPQLVELPKWGGGRVWQPVVDTSKVGGQGGRAGRGGKPWPVAAVPAVSNVSTGPPPTPVAQRQLNWRGHDPQEG